MAVEYKDRLHLRSDDQVNAADLERLFRHYDERIRELVADNQSLRAQVEDQLADHETRIRALE